MFADYLKGLMEQRRVGSQRAVATYIGATPTAVSRWLAGKHKPEPEYCRRIAVYFRVPEEEVLRAAGHQGAVAIAEPPPRYSVREAADVLERLSEEMVEIPVGEISAGPGAWTDLTFYLPRNLVGNHRIVGYRVRGQSMEPEIADGALVAVDLDRAPRDGDIVVAWPAEGGGWVKRLRTRRGKQELAGNDGEVIPVTEDVRIEGVVIFAGKFFG